MLIQYFKKIISFAFGAHEKASLIKINSYDLAKILLSNTKESKILEILNYEINNIKYLNSNHKTLTYNTKIKKLKKNIQSQISNDTLQKEIKSLNSEDQITKGSKILNLTAQVKAKKVKQLNEINHLEIAGNNDSSITVAEEIDSIITRNF